MKRKSRSLPQKPVRYESVETEPSVVQEVSLSMLELRQNASEIMASLEKGVKYSLTYRGRTVGKLLPVESTSTRVAPDDAIFRMEDFVSKGPKGHLSNEDIDRAVYGV